MSAPTPTAAPPEATDLPPQYDPAAVERGVAARWDAAKAWHAEASGGASGGGGGGGGDPYAIVIPPPNVTAALHLGHALNNTLQDALIRYHRMLGRNAMWMPGTDHAGIATQTVVEKRVLAEEGKRRTDFERDAFIAKVQAWKDEYEQKITGQLKSMGASCDWDRQRFTMDGVCAAAVREAFFRLFQDGLIYRGKRLVNWDPATQTALADDEVEMEEVDGNFWYMKYPVVEAHGSESKGFEETGDHVVVATTRPETMLGDTAVAVNPKDPDRAKYIGKHVRLPIVGRVIPIVGDEHVTIPLKPRAEEQSDEAPDRDRDDPKARYSSGFLKVTPAHDPNDWEIGRRHGLPVINVMGPDGSISLDHGWPPEERPGEIEDLKPLVGLSREDARKAIVKYFRGHGLLEETRPYRHAVGHSYRSHVPIEPYLSDQWYVKVTDDRLAGAALRAMAEDQRQRETEGPVWKGGGSFDGGSREDTWTGQLRFTPDRYAKTYQSWHENIRDWCISRQLWWGHRIPVWSAEGAGVPSSAEAASAAVTRDGSRTLVCLRDDDPGLIADLEAAGFAQDPDVLDTWFSSALWPVSTLGWPNPENFPDDFPDGDAALNAWHPTNVLCTGRDIITLWVSRMVMFSLYFTGKLPFHDVHIHPMILDGFGQRMSKSLGNGVDPGDIVHSHGADAMRYTLATMATATQDARLPVDTVDPHTGESFAPKTVTNAKGYTVAAPVQERDGKSMVTGYGLASGKAKPSDDAPLARNTSEKFDLGQRFANKLWNAVRFTLGNLTAEGSAPNPEPQTPDPSQDIASRWVLARLARTIRQTNRGFQDYEFARVADGLYDFFWRDLCDWYIEAVKPTASEDAGQRRVLAACVDAALRLLHPLMPFVTERLWAALNAAVPGDRSLPGLHLPPSELLMLAAWPRAERELIDEEAEHDFALIQDAVAAIREVRAQHGIPPRQALETTARAPGPIAQKMHDYRPITCGLANTIPRGVGPQVEKPANSATIRLGEVEVYIHGVADDAKETERLEKRKAELQKNIKALTGRLANKGYTEKAPAHLVEETRQQLADAEAELAEVNQQLG